MRQTLPLLTLLLCASASAQIHNDVQFDNPKGGQTTRLYDGEKLLIQVTLQRNMPAGQATMKVSKGETLLFQAITQGLNAVTESKFSPDGKWLLNIADGSGYIQLWNVGKGERVKTFLAPPPQYRGNFAEFTPDSQRLLLSFLGDGKTLGRASAGSFSFPLAESSLWDLGTLKRISMVSNLERQSFYDGKVRFSKSGERMIFAGRSSPASVWNAKTGAYIATLSRLPYPKGGSHIGGMGAQDASLSPDGTRALVRYDTEIGSKLAEYDAKAGKLLKVRPEMSDGQAMWELQQFETSGK